MKVWITKYALTTGIYEVECEMCLGTSINMIKTDYSFFHAGEWRESKEIAIAKAYEMKIKKLQSLDNQMKKISSLEFDGM